MPIAMTSLIDAALRRGNLARKRQGRPFDPTTSLGPPSGLHGWVHYGVMVPGLPEPHRTFGVMSVVGTPGVGLFANDSRITTSAADTAYVVSATGAMHSDTFATFSIQQDCELAPDGSLIRLGRDLTITGSYPAFVVRRLHPDADVELRLTATDKVTYFADLPGLYSHWSLLCEYDGSVGGAPVSGLCTFEYARGVRVPQVPVLGVPVIPTRFFSYHVINVDDRTQVLYAEARGPGGVVLVRALYVRGLDEYGCEYADAHLDVHETDGPRTTPEGRAMRLPITLSVGARDGDGADVLAIDGTSNGDWAYGLGAGYAGSYEYAGTFRGRAIAGTAYIEYVDLSGA